MILPGDILWDRFRVVRVDGDRQGCAWLVPRTPSADAKAGPTHLLLALKSPTQTPVATGIAAMAELLAALWPNGHSKAGSEATDSVSSGQRVNLPAIGDIEWRGVPQTGGVALLELAPMVELDATVNVNWPRTPDAVLRMIASFAALLERLFHSIADPKAREAFCRAATALLNPHSVGVTTEAARLMFVPRDGAQSATFGPPEWTYYAAPEAVSGEDCGEPALVFGVAQVALALLFEPRERQDGDETKQAAPQGWRRLALPESAFKEFKDDPRSADLPKSVAALLAKCLRPQPAQRFATLAKFRIALKKLVRAADPREQDAALPPPEPMPPPAPVPVPDNMIVIDAGPFLSGEKKIPRTLRAFAIDISPVTEREYRDFLKETHREPMPDGPGSRGPKFDRHPVVAITWHEAQEYAEHYGKRLPTVHEWEKAARGCDGWKFPYGDEYKAGTGKLRASGINSAPGKDTPKETAPIGSFPQGASPFGVLDTAGNVLEWTSTARRQGERLFRALKGSCFLDGSVELSRCAAVQYKKPESREIYVGFRCVKDLD